MTQVYTPVIRAFVAGTLLVATAAVLHVTVQTARAAGALAIGPCGAYGEAFNADEPRKSALVKCKGDTCQVVATVKHACAAMAVDFANEGVIRTFFYDAKG